MADDTLDLPDPGTHIPYKVTHQIESQTLTDAGTFQKVHHVHVQGPSGVRSSVTIPADQYTPEHVDRVIQDHLQNVEGVQALGPLPHPANAA
jgi:hypothetical protein